MCQTQQQLNELSRKIGWVKNTPLPSNENMKKLSLRITLILILMGAFPLIAHDVGGKENIQCAVFYHSFIETDIYGREKEGGKTLYSISVNPLPSTSFINEHFDIPVMDESLGIAWNTFIIKIIAEKGSLISNLSENYVNTFPLNLESTTKSFKDFSRNDMYDDMLTSFIDCINNQTKPDVSLLEGISTNEFAINLRDKYYEKN